MSDFISGIIGDRHWDSVSLGRLLWLEVFDILVGVSNSVTNQLGHYQNRMEYPRMSADSMWKWNADFNRAQTCFSLQYGQFVLLGNTFSSTVHIAHHLPSYTSTFHCQLSVLPSYSQLLLHCTVSRMMPFYYYRYIKERYLSCKVIYSIFSETQNITTQKKE